MALPRYQQVPTLLGPENDEGFLNCNFIQCGAKITERYVWMTFCSHVFCERHGYEISTRPLAKLRCPACNTKLHSHVEIFRVDCQPDAKFLKMALWGLPPSQCLAIAKNAISFWTYQSQCAKNLCDFANNQWEGKHQAIKTSYERLRDNLKQQIRVLKQENEELKRQAGTVAIPTDPIKIEPGTEEQHNEVVSYQGPPLGTETALNNMMTARLLYDVKASTLYSRFSYKRPRNLAK